MLRSISNAVERTNKAKAYQINSSISSNVDPLLNQWPLGKSVNANVLHSALFGKKYKEQIYIDNTSTQNQRFVEEEKPKPIEKDLQVIAYPNPANNVMTFKIINAEQKNSCQVSLFDIRGEKLLNFKLNESEEQKTISLESFSSGVYFYRVEDEEKVLQTNKLIIIK